MQTRARRPSRSALLAWAQVGLLLAPLVSEAIRLLVTGPANLALSGDTAVAQYDTRLAMRGRLSLGVYDHFGWHHPGPALYYLYAFGELIFGTRPEVLFATALAMNLAAIAGVVFVIYRRVGQRAAVAVSLLLGLLAAYLLTAAGTTGVAQVLAVLVSPWNPDAVILPLLAFLVLAGAALNSWRSCLVLLALGSLIVQADIGTAPVVGTILVVVVIARLVARRRASGAGGVGEREAVSTKKFPWVASAAILATVAMWIPPLIQQATSRRGNLSDLVSWFLGHRAGLSAVGLLRVVQYLRLAASDLATARWILVTPEVGADIVLGGLLVLGCIAGIVGVGGEQRYLRGLAALVLVALVASALAAATSYEPVYGYLIQWFIGVVGALAVMLVSWAALASARVASPGKPPWLATAGKAVAVAVVVAVTSVAVARVPSIATAGDPEVAHAWALAAHELARPGLPVEVDLATRKAYALATYEGFVEEFLQHGISPVVEPFEVPIAHSSAFGAGFLRGGMFGNSSICVNGPPPRVGALVVLTIAHGPPTTFFLGPPYPKLPIQVHVTVYPHPEPASCGGA